MVRLWLLLCSFFCLLALGSAGCGTYTSSDGSKYYLDALTKTADYSGVESASYIYWWNFCQNINKAATGTTCATATPVAQTTSSNTNCISTGYLPAAFADHPLGPKQGVKITYTNSVDLCGNPKSIPRVSNFILTCTPNTEYQFVKIEEPGTCQYQFSINTKYACPSTAPPASSSSSGTSGGKKGDDDGISAGSIFLIVFFSAAAVYLIVGVIVKWRVYNATGSELVPNVDFWVGFPGLIRDGFVFVKNKITGAVGYSTL